MKIPTDRKMCDRCNRIAVLACGMTVFIGVTGLIGWVSGLRVLTSIHLSYIPIAITTCIAFLLQGAVLAYYIRFPSLARLWPFTALTAVATILGVSSFIFRQPIGKIAITSLSPFAISPLTGVLFFFSGTALLLLLRYGTKKSTPHVTSGLASLVLIVGLIGTLGYVYETPLLYEGPILPMALTTSIAFVFLGVGLIAAVGPEGFLLRALGGSSVRAMLLRTFVPLGFIAVIASDILQHLVTRLNSAIVSGAAAVSIAIGTVALVAQAAGVIGAIIDKAEAERRSAVEKMAQQNEFLSTVLESLPHPFYVVDARDYTVKMANSAAAPDGILSNTTCHALTRGKTTPCHTPSHTCPLETIKRTKQQLIAEHIHYEDDGSLRNIEVHAFPILDSNGNVSQIIEYLLDITERKKAEEALRESEENYRSLFENMLDGFTYCRMIFEDGEPKDIEYLAVNRAFEELTGLDNVVGRKVTELIHGIRESNPEMFEILGKTALDGSPRRFEIYLEQLGAWFYISAYSMKKGYFVAVFDNITERKRDEEKIKHLALHDPLTDLPNRNLFFNRLSQAVQRANRYRHIVAVLYLDLDGFKEINDTLGHGAGDRILVETARRLEKCIRLTDTAARLGGDEFAIILHDLQGKEFVEIVTQRIIDSISEPFLYNGQSCLLEGVSIGISLYPSDAEDAEILMRRADQAMYAQKKSSQKGKGYLFCEEANRGDIPLVKKILPFHRPSK